LQKEAQTAWVNLAYHKENFTRFVKPRRGLRGQAEECMPDSAYMTDYGIDCPGSRRYVIYPSKEEVPDETPEAFTALRGKDEIREVYERHTRRLLLLPHRGGNRKIEELLGKKEITKLIKILDIIEETV
jgi:hypothetical protein